MLERIHRLKVRDLYLRFQSGEEFNVTFAEINYTINQVPTARVQIPLGRLFLSLSENPYLNWPASEGYDILARFNYYRYQLCQLIVDIDYPDDESGDNQPPPWSPPGRYLLFVGFIASAAYSLDNNNIPQVELQLKHFLEFLRASSLLNVCTQASNPSSLAYDPTMLFGGAGSDLNFSASTALYESITTKASDLWYHVLFPVFWMLTNIARLNARNLNLGLDNDATDAILGPIVKRTLSSYFPPCTAIPLWNIPVSLRHAMVDFLIENVFRADSFEQNLSTTMLDKLLEICNLFFLCLVPYPNTYAIRPFCLGLIQAYAPYRLNQGDPWYQLLTLPPFNFPSPELLVGRYSFGGTLPPGFGGMTSPPSGPYLDPGFGGISTTPNDGITFTPDSILAVHVNRTEPTFNVRGVCVFADYDNYSGLQINNVPEASWENIGGTYRSLTAGSGQVLFYPAPSYLKFGIVDAETSNVFDKDYPPTSRAPMQLSINPMVQITKFYHMIPTLHRFAQYVFILHQLSERVMTVVCPFRGDVAPGSTVRLLINDSDYAWESPQLMLQGTVVSVRYIFPSINQIPTTTYTIVGWRNLFEVYHPDFSIPSHPLYLVHHVGGPHLPFLPKPSAPWPFL